MNVLILTERVELRSGWGRYASSIIDEYRKRNITFSVLAVEPPENTKEPCGKLLRPTFKGLVTNCLVTRRAAREYDIVHAFDVWPFSFYGWAAVVGTRKKLFITGVGTYSVAPFDYLLKRVLLTLACRRAQKILSIGNYTKKRMLEKIFLNNIVTVFWGSSKLEELQPDRMAELYSEFGISPNRHPIILTVGMLKHRKGQLDTLKAISRLVHKYPDILYTVVGSTDDVWYVEQIKRFAKESGIEKNLKIIPNAYSDESIAFFYQACDVFVMNSNNDGEHFEGFGLVFLEAEQFGKPVVGSNNCGIEEALEEGYNGYLANQSDSEDIATKIDLILAGNTESFGRASKEFSARFSWSKTAQEYIAYYKA